MKDLGEPRGEPRGGESFLHGGYPEGPFGETTNERGDAIVARANKRGLLGGGGVNALLVITGVEVELGELSSSL